MEVEPLRSQNGTLMEEQPSSSAASGLKRRHKWRNICLGVMVALIIIIILIVILAFTVFKAKHAVTTIDSVSVSDLKFSLDLLRLQVLLNATLDVDVSIKNPNKVGFKYTDSAAQLNYRGQHVGEAPIPAGKISADKTVPLNLTLTVMADRLISDSKFFSDISGRELPLNTYTKISGKAHSLNFVPSNCKISLCLILYNWKAFKLIYQIHKRVLLLMLVIPSVLLMQSSYLNIYIETLIFCMLDDWKNCIILMIDHLGGRTWAL